MQEQKEVRAEDAERIATEAAQAAELKASQRAFLKGLQKIAYKRDDSEVPQVKTELRELLDSAPEPDRAPNEERTDQEGHDRAERGGRKRRPRQE